MNAHIKPELHDITDIVETMEDLSGRCYFCGSMKYGSICSTCAREAKLENLYASSQKLCIQCDHVLQAYEMQCTTCGAKEQGEEEWKEEWGEHRLMKLDTNKENEAPCKCQMKECQGCFYEDKQVGSKRGRSLC